MGFDLELAVNRARLVPGDLVLAYSTLNSIGIPFLDEALTGIISTDLMLLGAVSGVGKTQACLEIAKFAATKRRRTLFIALEAETREIEMRLLYQLESRLYFKDPARPRGPYVNYRNWRLGMLDAVFGAYKLDAQRLFAERYSNYLWTAYRDRSFGINDLKTLLDSAPTDFDLVVLDHLHYFDMAGGRDSEQEKLTALIKAIRDLNLFHKIPFIVAAHVRKNFIGIMPGQEDFMGSSDIYKNATIVAMFGKKPNGYHPKLDIQETLITLPKIRTGGLGNLCGVVNFSLPHQGYDVSFKLGRLTNRNENFESLKEEEYPSWAQPKKDGVSPATNGG